jgi:hypothetical protein
MLCENDGCSVSKLRGPHRAGLLAEPSLVAFHVLVANGTVLRYVITYQWLSPFF